MVVVVVVVVEGRDSLRKKGSGGMQRALNEINIKNSYHVVEFIHNVLEVGVMVMLGHNSGERSDHIGPQNATGNLSSGVSQGSGWDFEVKD